MQIYIVVLLATYGAALLGGSCESIMPEQPCSDDLTLCEVVFGWIGDRLPRRHALFLFGLSMLLLATAMLAFGRHITVLALGRLLQGLSAAVVWTSGLSLFTDIFGQDRYGEAIGYAQTSVSIGTTSAPLMGGIVYARGGYAAVSAMSIGIIVISITLALLMVEPEIKAGWEEPVAGCPTTGNWSQNAVSEEVSRIGGSIQSPSTIEPVSRYSDERSPLIHKEHKEGNSKGRPAYPFLLRSGRILAAMGGMFCFSFVVISFEGLVPLFVKETFHWDSTRAALIFLSWIIPGFLGPVVGKASDRLGPRWIAVGGLLFAVPPLVFMRFVTKDSTSHKVLFCSLLTLAGKYSFVCSCLSPVLGLGD